MTPTLYAAADVSYFSEHGYAFVRSAVNNGMPVVVDVFPNLTNMDGTTDDLHMIVDSWKDMDLTKFKDFVLLRGADEKFFTDVYTASDIEDLRAFMASYRFMNSPRLLTEYDDVLIVDIDSIIMKKVELPDEYDAGLYFRTDNVVGANEWEREGMKIAAGSVLLTKRAGEFATEVANHLIYSPIKWFSDQRALWDSYNKFKDRLNFCHLERFPLLDWDFTDGSMIWTGKGDRKRNDPRYVAAKRSLESGNVYI